MSKNFFNVFISVMLLISTKSIYSSWPQHLLNDKDERGELGIDAFNTPPLFLDYKTPRVKVDLRRKSSPGCHNSQVSVDAFLDEYASLLPSQQQSPLHLSRQSQSPVLNDFGLLYGANADNFEWESRECNTPRTSVNAFLREYKSRSPSPLSINEIQDLPSNTVAVITTQNTYPRYCCHLAIMRLALSVARRICWDGFSDQTADEQDAAEVKKWWEEFACDTAEVNRVSVIESYIDTMTRDEQRYYRLRCKTSCRQFFFDNVMYHAGEEFKKRYPMMYPGRQTLNK